ncbi:hypothetical protein RSSM_05952 [Rhodopirellula sallentina SM41]|uniref:Uncharacterized protein n=1 Tax=Rhodopirellula sallentina SM41 TaxID=1263870 RepID=M5TTS9_9BACT|nr:hypothetical protein RSSM_05952 [Rhodopirellula sallentina SM41]
MLQVRSSQNASEGRCGFSERFCKRCASLETVQTEGVLGRLQKKIEFWRMRLRGLQTQGTRML